VNENWCQLLLRIIRNRVDVLLQMRYIRIDIDRLASRFPARHVAKSVPESVFAGFVRLLYRPSARDRFPSRTFFVRQASLHASQPAIFLTRQRTACEK